MLVPEKTLSVTDPLLALSIFPTAASPFCRIPIDLALLQAVFMGAPPLDAANIAAATTAASCARGKGGKTDTNFKRSNTTCYQS